MGTQKTGFTLIELTIVMVIIGLVAGGVLVGKSLIANAQKQQFMSALNETLISWNTFKTKYDCVPGDCTDATLFFGKKSSCSSEPGELQADGVCNGNGDGFTGDTGVTAYDMLEAADMLPHYFTQNTSKTPSGFTMFSNAFFNYASMTFHNAPDVTFGGERGTSFTLASGGAIDMAMGTTSATYMSPVVMSEFDIKYDDGDASTGTIKATGVSLPQCAVGSAYGTDDTGSPTAICIFKFLLDTE